jgi:hypothetical protein
VNHGISARIDPKTTPYSSPVKKRLMIFYIFFSILVDFRSSAKNPPESVALVQTDATIGGLYACIPTGEAP